MAPCEHVVSAGGRRWRAVQLTSGRLLAAAVACRRSSSTLFTWQFLVSFDGMSCSMIVCVLCLCATMLPGCCDKQPHHQNTLPSLQTPRVRVCCVAGAFSALLVFRNPYIYAVLTVVTILPQNSNVTSLNNLVLLFYESGVFANFGEAVTAVRLVTWLSMIFMVGSFAVFK